MTSRALATTQATPALALVSASSQYLSHVDAASLRMGAVSWWAGLVNYTILPASGSVTTFLCKGVPGDREWMLSYENNPDPNLGLRFTVWSGATEGGRDDVYTNAALSTPSWHFVMAYMDGLNNLIAISLDGGAFTTLAHTGGGYAGTNPFTLSSQGNGTQGLADVLLAQVCIGKDPPSWNATLANTIRDTLYQAGQYLDVRRIAATTKTAWGGVSAWPLDEYAGTRRDAWGSNDLTANNSPLATTGIVTGRILAGSRSGA